MPKQQPSAKTEMIEQLQRTIEQLQTVVESLQTDSVDRLPPQNAVDNLVRTSDRLPFPSRPNLRQMQKIFPHPKLDL